MKVKFFITPVYPYGNDHYYHEIIALAEGFAELGHEIFANADYWWQPESGSCLLKGDADNTDFDLAVYDYRYVTSFAHLLFRKGFPNFDRSKKHVLVDRNDWISPVWYKNKNYDIFDLVFAGNLYQAFDYAANIRPWAIGLTNRIIRSIDAHYLKGQMREKIAGYNFRVDHNMRGYVLSKLKNELKKYPAAERFTKPSSDNKDDAFYYKASVRRHNPEYYTILCRSLLFMSFGGYYDFRPVRYQPYTFTDKLLRKPAYWRYKMKHKAGKDFSDDVFIFQQDNFRFWEVLYSGAIAINIDLDFWKFRLPVMPVTNKHYIGIQNLSATSVEEQVAALSEQQLTDISVSARQWVYDNYSPRAQAQRVINELNKLQDKKQG